MSIHDAIRARRIALGWSHERLAAEVSTREGLSKPLSWQTVQQWENATSAPKRTRLGFVASALGCTVEDLLLAEVDEPAVAVAQVAHSVILQPKKLPAQHQWREIMEGKEIEGLFEVMVPDGALLPDIQPGWRIQCDTREHPTPGDDVIVRDRRGSVHLRRYRQARAGTWDAAALNDDYLSFNSEDDGLSIVAVVVSYVVPRGARQWGS